MRNEIENDLKEAEKLALKISKKLARSKLSEGDRITFLYKKIDLLRKKELNKENKIALLSHLFLLSETCLSMDFERLIQAREKFQSIFPLHFKQYLEKMSGRTKGTTWSGCFSCKHYVGARCELNKIPLETHLSYDRIDYYCPSRVKK